MEFSYFSNNSNALIEKTFNTVLRACEFEYLVSGNTSIWCKFFDTRMLKALELQDDIKYNCKYSQKRSLTREMVRALLAHLSASLSEYTEA